MYTDFRLKIQRFFRKYGKIILIAVIIWLLIFIINKILQVYEAPVILNTTYEPHISVMDKASSVPKSVSNPIEDMIEDYVNNCNNSDWEMAYNMLSDECKEYSFNNDIRKFMEYVYTKMPTPKKYAIQNYSNNGNTYIYQIKYTDDLLATGLTNTTYQYTEEKMIFKKQKDNSIKMSVGNYVDFGEIKNIFENEYVKIDVKNVIKYYSLESYTVRITNRSGNTIVISDGYENNNLQLKLSSSDVRNPTSIDNIVLNSGQSINLVLNFQKFYDNKDDAVSLNFNNIRIIENYSKDNIESNRQNTIANFSATIPVIIKE